MKHLYWLFLFILQYFIGYSQNRTADTLLLKGGKIILGTITLDKPDTLLKIRTKGDVTYQFQYSQIDKISHGRIIPVTVKKNATPDSMKVKPKLLSFIGVNLSYDDCYKTQLDRSASWHGYNRIYHINGFTAGFDLYTMLSRKTYFETGIQYAKRGFAGDAPTFITNAPYLYFDVGKATHNMHYIDIPLKFDFTLLEDEIKLSLGLGFDFNVFINELVYNEPGNASLQPTSVVDTYWQSNVSAMIDLGLMGQISKVSYLKVAPTYRYMLAQDVSRLLSLGVNLTYYYCFSANKKNNTADNININEIEKRGAALVNQ